MASFADLFTSVQTNPTTDNRYGNNDAQKEEQNKAYVIFHSKSKNFHVVITPNDCNVHFVTDKVKDYLQSVASDLRHVNFTGSAKKLVYVNSKEAACNFLSALSGLLETGDLKDSMVYYMARKLLGKEYDITLIYDMIDKISPSNFHQGSPNDVAGIELARQAAKCNGSIVGYLTRQFIPKYITRINEYVVNPKTPAPRSRLSEAMIRKRCGEEVEKLLSQMISAFTTYYNQYDLYYQNERLTEVESTDFDLADQIAKQRDYLMDFLNLGLQLVNVKLTYGREITEEDKNEVNDCLSMGMFNNTKELINQTRRLYPNIKSDEDFLHYVENYLSKINTKVIKDIKDSILNAKTLDSFNQNVDRMGEALRKAIEARREKKMKAATKDGNKYAPLNDLQNKYTAIENNTNSYDLGNHMFGGGKSAGSDSQVDHISLWMKSWDEYCDSSDAKAAVEEFLKSFTSDNKKQAQVCVEKRLLAIGYGEEDLDFNNPEFVKSVYKDLCFIGAFGRTASKNLLKYRNKTLGEILDTTTHTKTKSMAIILKEHLTGGGSNAKLELVEFAKLCFADLLVSLESC